MGITPKFTQADVMSYVQQQLKAYRDVVILRLKYAGELFVKLAKENGDYTDQTGNLRSSVGYIILYNGVPLINDFEQVLGGIEGISKGRQLALEVAPKTGYVLVGVAGMDYASSVESRGKDVITGSAQQVEIWLRQAMKRAA